MSNYCPAPARFNHRASGITFVVTARPFGRGSYDVEFRRKGKSLGTLRDVRPPQCRTADNAHKSDDRLVIEAAIGFATCGPREAGHTREEIERDPDLAELRELLKGERKTRDYASVRLWEGQCYHPPTYGERLMVALNEIIEGYGVEHLHNKEGEAVADYVNLGDTYTVTLIRKYTGTVMVTTMGDYYVESNPNIV